MKTVILILSALLILCGIGTLTMPIAIFSSSKNIGILSLILAIGACIVAACCIATGFQHIRKKDKDTALVVATTSGFLAWLILNPLALKFTRGKDDHVWQFAGLLVPILLCYYGTKAVKKSIRQKYET
jgi:drug/metabolite transporter (DMT)-like permease